MPCAAIVIASVAMKGWMRSCVTARPLQAPHNAPASTPAASAPVALCGDSSADTTEPSAATLPTDRSMPPDMITNAMPIETSANIVL